MHPLIQIKKATPLRAIILLLTCFALMPLAQAVVPAPDGGYPGQNTAEGQSALLHLAGGTYNTALGWASLGFNVTGNYNTAVGAATLLSNTAVENTATGAGALLSNTIGNDNTANGVLALSSNTTGVQNTAIGSGALINNIVGNENTAVGDGALDISTGNFNIALGFGAGAKVTTASNVICIGANGNNVDDSCFIGNIFGATSSNGVGVLVNSNGRLGTMPSSARFKEDIKPMGKASEALFALKPIAFRYKKDIDPAGVPQLGLVAEEVEKVNPDLVVRDKEGKPYSVRYDQVNAMLLNEFLKEHRKVEQLTKDFESKLTEQQEQIKALIAGLQKVSAQLEASKPAPQIVNNP